MQFDEAGFVVKSVVARTYFNSLVIGIANGR